MENKGFLLGIDDDENSDLQLSAKSKNKENQCLHLQSNNIKTDPRDIPDMSMKSLPNFASSGLSKGKTKIYSPCKNDPNVSFARKISVSSKTKWYKIYEGSYSPIKAELGLYDQGFFDDILPIQDAKQGIKNTAEQIRKVLIGSTSGYTNLSSKTEPTAVPDVLNKISSGRIVDSRNSSTKSKRVHKNLKKKVNCRIPLAKKHVGRVSSSDFKNLIGIRRSTQSILKLPRVNPNTNKYSRLHEPKIRVGAISDPSLNPVSTTKKNITGTKKTVTFLDHEFNEESMSTYKSKQKELQITQKSERSIRTREDKLATFETYLASERRKSRKFCQSCSSYGDYSKCSSTERCCDCGQARGICKGCVKPSRKLRGEILVDISDSPTTKLETTDLNKIYSGIVKDRKYMESIKGIARTRTIGTQTESRTLHPRKLLQKSQTITNSFDCIQSPVKEEKKVNHIQSKSVNTFDKNLLPINKYVNENFEFNIPQHTKLENDPYMKTVHARICYLENMVPQCNTAKPATRSMECAQKNEIIHGKLGIINEQGLKHLQLDQQRSIVPYIKRQLSLPTPARKTVFSKRNEQGFITKQFFEEEGYSVKYSSFLRPSNVDIRCGRLGLAGEIGGKKATFALAENRLQSVLDKSSSACPSVTNRSIYDRRYQSAKNYTSRGEASCSKIKCTSDQRGDNFQIKDKLTQGYTVVVASNLTTMRSPFSPLRCLNISATKFPVQKQERMRVEIVSHVQRSHSIHTDNRNYLQPINIYSYNELTNLGNDANMKHTEKNSEPPVLKLDTKARRSIPDLVQTTMHSCTSPVLRESFRQKSSDVHSIEQHSTTKYSKEWTTGNYWRGIAVQSTDLLANDNEDHFIYDRNYLQNQVYETSASDNDASKNYIRTYDRRIAETINTEGEMNKHSLGYYPATKVGLEKDSKASCIFQNYQAFKKHGAGCR